MPLSAYLGDMATHFIILFSLHWECCQEVWQTVNCRSKRSWEFKSLHFPSQMLMIYVVDFFLYSGPYHYVVYLYSDAFMYIFLNWFLYIMLLPTFFGFPVLSMLTSSSQRKPGTVLSRYLIPIWWKHQRYCFVVWVMI